MKLAELKIIFPSLTEAVTGVVIEEKKITITLNGVEIDETGNYREVKGIGKTVDEAMGDIARTLSQKNVVINHIYYTLPIITLD